MDDLFYSSTIDINAKITKFLGVIVGFLIMADRITQTVSEMQSQMPKILF